jgi:hypothetical protein
MLCALMAAAFWLIFATYAELPVSTTHSISESPRRPSAQLPPAARARTAAVPAARTWGVASPGARHTTPPPPVALLTNTQQSAA